MGVRIARIVYQALLLLFICIGALLIFSEPAYRRKLSDYSEYPAEIVPRQKIKKTIFFDRVTRQTTRLMLLTPKGWRLRPNCRGVNRAEVLSGQDIRIRTNNLGLRGPDLGQKSPSEYRILVLGDSITLADYAQEPDTIPAGIEMFMGRPGFGGRRKTRVVNGGIGSLDLKGETELLKEMVRRVSADRVVLALYLNDANPSLVIGDAPWPLSKCGWTQALWGRSVFAFFEIRLHGRRAQLEKWTRSFAGAQPRRTFLKGQWVYDPAAFKREIIKAVTDWGYAWYPDA
ncbi:MAG: hypothetical protein WCG06_04980, partial [Candidatus Omnitrophota bacterium]